MTLSVDAAVINTNKDKTPSFGHKSFCHPVILPFCHIIAATDYCWLLLTTSIYLPLDITLYLVVVVVVVIVFTLKTVPISAQYLLTSVLVQLKANAFRGYRLTTQKGYIL